MINFKRPEDRTASFLMVFSLLTLAGALAYMLFVPAPSVAGIARGRERSRQSIQKEITTAQTQAKQSEAETRTRLWKGNPELITASVLAQVTNQANKQALKLTAFRPQRVQILEGVTELPYSLQISGPYPVVRAMVRFLDDPRNKLALRSVQLASSDSSTSAVTATIAISAYTTTTVAPPAPKTKKSGATHG